MDLKNLSSNWKQLQETLKQKPPNPSSPKTPSLQDGVKRKRGRTFTKDPVPPLRKKPRMGERSMAQNGLDTKGKDSTKNMQDAAAAAATAAVGGGERLPLRTPPEAVNAGLSAGCVYTQGIQPARTCWLTKSLQG